MDENQNKLQEPGTPTTPTVMALLDTLSCPVCFEPTPPPIMQCVKGHNICLHCQMKVDMCPICRGAHSPTRNLFAESVFELLVDPVTCKYAAEGCSEKFSGNHKLDEHEVLCPLRDYICNVRSSKLYCNEELVPLSKFEDHMRTAHRLKEVPCNYGSARIHLSRTALLVPDQLFNEAKLDPWVLRCNGKNFVAMRSFTSTHLYLWVTGNVSDIEAKEYHATIKIKNFNNVISSEVTWKGPVHSGHALQEIFDFENNPTRCLKIPFPAYMYIGELGQGSRTLSLKHYFQIDHVSLESGN